MTTKVGHQSSAPALDLVQSFEAGLTQAQRSSLGLFMAPIGRTGGQVKGQISVPSRANITTMPAADQDYRPERGPATRVTFDEAPVEWTTQARAFAWEYDKKSVAAQRNPAAVKSACAQRCLRYLLDAHEARVLTAFNASLSSTSQTANCAVSTFETNLITGIEAILDSCRITPNRCVLPFGVAHDLLTDSTLAGKINPVTLDQTITTRALSNWLQANYGLVTRIGYSPNFGSSTSVSGANQTVYLYYGGEGSAAEEVMPETYEGSALTFFADSILDMWDESLSHHAGEIGVEWPIDEVVINPYQVYGMLSVT